MIESLKIHIKESKRPVGVKKPSHMKLPSLDHIYGYKPKTDLEGADISKSLLNKLYNYFLNFSYKKLEISRSFEIIFAAKRLHKN